MERMKSGTRDKNEIGNHRLEGTTVAMAATYASTSTNKFEILFASFAGLQTSRPGESCDNGWFTPDSQAHIGRTLDGSRKTSGELSMGAEMASEDGSGRPVLQLQVGTCGHR